jgi:protein-S-isoprenylcysteine O-methyltransferase Ste14
VSHSLFWVALVLPGAVGLFYPGLATYDALLGVPGLPESPFWMVSGVVLLSVGSALVATSNRLLIRRGRGAPAFLLTEQLVTGGLYERTRNPMSLGFYAACLGIGMIAGSLTVTVGFLLTVLPAHVINLKDFEEYELELRYGLSYMEYKQRVPFLIPRFSRRGQGAA